MLWDELLLNLVGKLSKVLYRTSERWLGRSCAVRYLHVRINQLLVFSFVWKWKFHPKMRKSNSPALKQLAEVYAAAWLNLICWAMIKGKSRMMKWNWGRNERKQIKRSDKLFLMISKKEQASFWATLSPHQIFFLLSAILTKNLLNEMISKKTIHVQLLYQRKY